MKSIIKNINKWIFKNSKRHCLYYSSFQESIAQNKEDSSFFQHKHHSYYQKRYNYYCFNNRWFDLLKQ
jgi:hypothetical protein